MRRISRKIALCCVLLVLAPIPCFSGDPPVGAQDVNRAGLFIDLPTSDRLLGDLEMCRIVREENVKLQLLDDKNSQLDEIRKEREALLRERIGFLERQQGELIRLNDQALKVGKQAGAKWYEELFTAGKWIGLGILVGFVAGAAR